MSDTLFPPLVLDAWQETRDTVRLYAQVVGKVRRALAPPMKHWWHAALEVSTSGLTTTPLPASEFALSLALDLLNHRLVMHTSAGHELFIRLKGQAVNAFRRKLLSLLHEIEVEVEIEDEALQDDAARVYDPAAALHYFRILSRIDLLMKRYKSELREETGPVVLWPHHFDLAVLWFSGRLVPDQDPDDPEYADEQVNAGFVPGDDSIPEAYFYVTAYPTPDGWTDTPLPQGAYWLTEGFTGAILPYRSLVEADEPEELLLDYLRRARRAAAELMR